MEDIIKEIIKLIDHAEKIDATWNDKERDEICNELLLLHGSLMGVDEMIHTLHGEVTV